MAVFENESNASQDASYREHLDRNWLNGNISFDQINQNIVNLQTLFTDLSNQISAVADRVSTLESENNERLQRLEDAIFNAEYINDTNEKSDVDRSTKVSEINDDIVPDPSTNDTVVIESGNDVIIPDKIN